MTTGRSTALLALLLLTLAPMAVACQGHSAAGDQAGASSATPGEAISDSVDAPTDDADPAMSGDEGDEAAGGDEGDDAGPAIEMPSGLKIEFIEFGDGPAPEPGQMVTVHYTGWLTDGTKFDSSHDRGEPFTFQIGTGKVIKGWDEGVANMKVGSKAKLTIPPEIGYGPKGAGDVIPPDATLIFEVELLGIK